MAMVAKLIPPMLIANLAAVLVLQTPIPANASWSAGLTNTRLPAQAKTQKTQVIATVRQWRDRVLELDRKAQNEQARTLNQVSSLDLRRDLNQPQALENLTRELESPLDRLQELDDERLELKAQRQIIDQLVSRLDSRWGGTDLKGFLVTTFLDLAQNDLVDPGHGTWSRFLVQAALALRDTAEPGADPVRFLENYMSESKVLTPKSVLEIMGSQKYSGN